MIQVCFCGEREVDWQMLQSALDDGPRTTARYHVTWARTLAEAHRAVSQGHGDVFVVDESIGDEQGFELVALASASSGGAPVLLLMNTGAALAEEGMAIQAGASDVLPRDELSARGLRRSLVHALARASARRRAPEVTTGLANAATLGHRLEAALSPERLARSATAVLAVGIDGTPADIDPVRLTNSLAERLLSCAREVDTVSTIGDGVFLVLLEGLAQAAQADVQSDRLLGALEAPLVVPGREVKLRISGGLAVAPEDSESGGELLEGARRALLTARQQGQRLARLGPQNDKAQRRWQLRRALDGALERGEFSLHYQPQVALRDDRVTGVEALLRWRSPTLGPVSPAEFVPLLEATGQIDAVGQWVLGSACAQASLWQRGGLELKVGVNASARQLARDDFGPICERALGQTKLPARLLGIEITEGLLLEGSTQVRDRLQQLRRLGVSISVDDFGTGYASLSYIKRFPMDVIKIDREFVRGTPLDVENVAITSAILALGNSLGLKVIAEGVEVESELEFLRSLGCDEVQGFYFAKPMPPNELERWIASRATA